MSIEGRAEGLVHKAGPLRHRHRLLPEEGPPRLAPCALLRFPPTIRLPARPSMLQWQAAALRETVGVGTNGD